jgi:hypothetical protein
MSDFLVCYPALPPVPQPAPFPLQEPDLYPVFAGPGAFYPREAKVPPVYEGGGPAYVPPAPKDENAEPEDHSPIITPRETWETWDEEWYPRSPRLVARTLRSAGWSVRVGFSRGYVPGQKADTYVLRDMIGVWADGYGKRAAWFWERNPEAEFTAKKLERGIKPGEIPSGMEWSTSGTTIIMGNGVSWVYASHTDLLEWAQLQGAVLPSWYEHIQAWVQAHEERDKRKAKGKAQADADAKEAEARAR